MSTNADYLRAQAKTNQEVTSLLKRKLDMEEGLGADHQLEADIKDAKETLNNPNMPEAVKKEAEQLLAEYYALKQRRLG